MHPQGSLQSQELEISALGQELKNTQQRAAEAEALHKRVADQLEHEKSACRDAEQTLHICTKERDALEAACDAAAGEISQLRGEVSAVKSRLEEQHHAEAEQNHVRYTTVWCCATWVLFWFSGNVGCIMQGRELTIAAAHANAIQEEAHQAQQLHKETLVAILDLLSPSCISSLLSSSGADACLSPQLEHAEGQDAAGAADASEFYSMRLRIASSSQVSKPDAATVLDRLTRVVGNAVYAAERAEQVESTLRSRKAAAEASARTNIPALHVEIERTQLQVADLVELLEIKEAELEEVRIRMIEAADTADGLAKTLGDQETEIRILHAALEDAQDEAATAAARPQLHSVATQARICALDVGSVMVSCGTVAHMCYRHSVASSHTRTAAAFAIIHTNQNSLQVGNSTDSNSPQQYLDGPQSTAARQECALQDKDHCIQSLQQQLASQTSAQPPSHRGIVPRMCCHVLHICLCRNYNVGQWNLLHALPCSARCRTCRAIESILCSLQLYWLSRSRSQRIAQATGILPCNCEFSWPGLLHSWFCWSETGSDSTLDDGHM